MKKTSFPYVVLWVLNLLGVLTFKILSSFKSKRLYISMTEAN